MLIPQRWHSEKCVTSPAGETDSCALPPQILVYSLEAERCLSKLGNALGDFTCVNLRDSPPHLMVSGNMDRR